MGSKVIILMGLFLAVTLLVSSEIATARQLPETENAVDLSKEADETTDAAATRYGEERGGHSGRTGNGGGHGGKVGGGGRGGNGGRGHGGGGHGGGGHGGGRHGGGGPGGN